MFKKKLLSAIKKSFFIGFSAFLFGTGSSILAPQTSASPGFFEYQWDPEPGYKRLKYYQSSYERNERSTYYFFLRGKERTEAIEKLNKSSQEELKKLSNVHWWPVKTSKISSEAIYNSGQIFLIGDSAHPIYPHLAQGASQTFLDALTLLKVLSSNNDINLSLIEYAKIRTATINRVKDMSYIAGGVFSAKGTIARIRNNLLLNDYLDLENFLNKIWEIDSPLNNK